MLQEEVAATIKLTRGPSPHQNLYRASEDPHVTLCRRHLSWDFDSPSTEPVEEDDWALTQDLSEDCAELFLQFMA